MKIISFYLPQFHTFPENDEWWGKGFTEWTNTKKAKPLFKNHYQPHIPYNSYYYDLSNTTEVMKKQIDLAHKYGVYGFCFYHYWFGKGKKLMEKPIENFLQDKSLDINFCISWANEPWTRRWDGGSKKVLMPQVYGNESDWEDHFNYLLPFFKDERYIKINGKPLILIYRPEIIECLKPMLELWRKLARENGLSDLFIMAQGSTYCRYVSTREKKHDLDAYLMYEPGYTYCAMALKDKVNFIKNFLLYTRLFLHYLPKKIFSMVVRDYYKGQKKKPIDICDYDVLWSAILKNKVYDDYFPGAFPGWDNSPRRGCDARIIVNGTPEKFKKYMKKLILRTRKEFHKDYIFMNAWNEWAEGAHLEPDQKYGFAYLEALRDALKETNEMEGEVGGAN